MVKLDVTELHWKDFFGLVAHSLVHIQKKPKANIQPVLCKGSCHKNVFLNNYSSVAVQFLLLLCGILVVFVVFSRVG